MDRVLGEHGIPQDSAAGRQEFERRMEQRRALESGKEFKEIRRGWCLGDEAFRKELLAQMEEKLGAEHFGQERRETNEAKAERIVQEEMKKTGWTEENLERQRKGDKRKVQMARRLREETTMTFQWIADRLRMGTKTHLAHLLYWQEKS